jgi:hypothetical protein
MYGFSTLKIFRLSALAVVLFGSFVMIDHERSVAATTRTFEKSNTTVETPPMFVLQIGIGKYVNARKWQQLSGAVNDVVEMRKLLEGERFKVPKENIRTLTDEAGTKRRIFEQYRNHLVARARDHFNATNKRDAVAVFQFSGHGSQAPDADGDEKDDKLDETLVTYDSQDVEGKNFDITDDEIYALTTELRQYTNNIVYILDSCHSGSGTRDPEEEIRRLPARKTVPVPISGFGAATRSGASKPKDAGPSSILPPGDDYIVITAARADELAGQTECFEECGKTDRPVTFGNLTFALINELRNARSDTSYREVMENVVRRVHVRKSTQTPQIEGDKQRFVFGNLASSEDNFARITGAGELKSIGGRGLQEIRINAGGMQGITAGTMVSIYDKAVTRFDAADKLASGTVRTVGASESVVQVVESVRAITTEDKAVPGAAGLGTLRLRISLDIDSSKFSANDRLMVDALRSSMTPGLPNVKDASGVDLVPAVTKGTAPRWELALLKDKYSNVTAKIPGAAHPSFFCENLRFDRSDGDYARSALEAAKELSPVRDVYYFAGPDFVPVYRYCAEADVSTQQLRSALSYRFQEVLMHFARLKSVGGISNPRTKLKGKLVVRPVKLSPPFTCENSLLKFSSQSPAVLNKSTDAYDFLVNEAFWFEVTNNSPVDLYLALLNMAPDGSVKLFAPSKISSDENGVIVKANGGKRILNHDSCRGNGTQFYDPGAMVASGPPALDRFKLIASTSPAKRDDFAFLEMGALRNRGPLSLAGASDWIAIDIAFNVIDDRQ